MNEKSLMNLSKTRHYYLFLTLSKPNAIMPISVLAPTMDGVSNKVNKSMLDNICAMRNIMLILKNGSVRVDDYEMRCNMPL